MWEGLGSSNLSGGQEEKNNGWGYEWLGIDRCYVEKTKKTLIQTRCPLFLSFVGLIVYPGEVWHLSPISG